MDTRLYIIMGVAGSGKSSVGKDVASRLEATYIDGDDYHPKSNIEKMEAGEPLDDQDRWPWLKNVAKALREHDGVVLAGCSALKKSYRRLLIEETKEPLQFIYLDGSRDLIGRRMAQREGHFMPTSLLESQFKALEVPDHSENHVSICINRPQPQVVDLIVSTLKGQQRRSV